MTAVSADKQILRGERARCRGLVKHAMDSVTFLGALESWSADSVLELLRHLDRDMRIGKNPPRPKRWSNRRVCSHCEGEEDPPGHNKATCKKRFRELAAGKAAA